MSRNDSEGVTIMGLHELHFCGCCPELVPICPPGYFWEEINGWCQSESNPSENTCPEGWEFDGGGPPFCVPP